MSNIIKFAKLRPSAIIPKKIQENAGYDIFADLEEDYVIINQGETKLIPTGLCSAFSSDYVLVFKERSSTGTKGMAVRSGIIDSGFRGEHKVAINNTSTKIVVLIKNEEVAKQFKGEEYLLYSTQKAICQGLLLPVPKFEVQEVALEDILNVQSERKDKGFGSTNKVK